MTVHISCGAAFLCSSQAGRHLLFGPSQSLGRSWCQSRRCPSPLTLWVLCWSSRPLSPGSGYEVVGRGQRVQWWSGWPHWCGSCVKPTVLWHSAERPGLAARWPAAGQNSLGRAASRCPGSVACEQVACSSSCGLERHLHMDSIITMSVFSFLSGIVVINQRKKISLLTTFCFMFDSQKFIKAMQQAALCSAPTWILHWFCLDPFINQSLWHTGVVFPPMHVYMDTNTHIFQKHVSFYK